jgi:hypothetical protein
MAKKKKKKGDKKETPPPVGGTPPMGAPPEATHFAVPVPVFDAVVKTISDLPWSRVAPLMGALQNCQPISVPQGANPGDMAPGLKRKG